MTAGAASEGVGLVVAKMQEGEWLKYTFRVSKAGNYDLHLATVGKGRVSVGLNGTGIGAAETKSGFKALVLLQGRNTLVVRAESSGLDLKTISIEPAGLRTGGDGASASGGPASSLARSAGED